MEGDVDSESCGRRTVKILRTSGTTTYNSEKSEFLGKEDLNILQLAPRDAIVTKMASTELTPV